jgi:TetR/AcrR family transcriptional repressor of bet genes
VRTNRETLRRAALLDAAIAEIGEKRSMSVTVSEIAQRAGVSSALAHHYFGTKRNLLVSAMHRILVIYGDEVRRELQCVESPADRIEGIVRASFAPSNFRPDVVRTWLILYMTAQTEPEAARLLAIYRKRIRSNLSHALRPLAGEDCSDLAELVAAMIDGFYIRRALGDEAEAKSPPDEIILSSLRRLLAPTQ